MPRLAVLPFEVPDTAPDTAFLGDGIPESIINRLNAALPELVVAPRALSFQFRGSDIDFADVARSLNVDAVVTGRVIQHGDRLVVRPELTDIANRRHLWGDRFDEKMSDILRVEEAIATEIAKALMPELTGQQRQQLAKSDTDDPRAHLAYLNGRFWWRQHRPEANRRAMPYFEDAIAADPGFALAYAGIADVYSTRTGLSADESRTKAKAAIRKAMALDDSLAEVQTAQGLVNMIHEWDWEAAEKNYRRALEINPDFGWAHHVYGHLLTVLYRYDEARAHFERALELEPRNTDNYVCLGGQYLRMGLYAEAERVLTDPRATDTPFGLDLCSDYLGWLYLRQKKYDEAIAVFERAVQESNRGWYAVSLLATGEAMRGNEPQARALLDELLTRPRPANVAGEFLAPIYVALGDDDEAMRLLEESYESHVNMWLPVELFRPGFSIIGLSSYARLE
jgi:TolB-like protein/tetratricopeptide (TPR) repeat protein